MIDKNRVRLKVFGSAPEQNTRDGTKLQKWFNLKLASESTDFRGKKSLEARVGFELTNGGFAVLLESVS